MDSAAQEMIDWLNENSGAVQAFAVIALVMVTAVYAGFTWRMVRAIREQTLAQDRPVLLVHVEVAGIWHASREQSQENPWLYTYPENFGCQIYNAGRHVAKEILVTIVHPGVLFKTQAKGFLMPGELWHTALAAEPLLQHISDRKPMGLSACLAMNGQLHEQDSFYDAGAVVYYRDIHDTAWATYLALNLLELKDKPHGKVTERALLLGKQRIIRLRQK